MNEMLLSIVTRLTANVDQIERVDEVLQMLEQCFLSVFKPLELEKTLTNAAQTGCFSATAETSTCLRNATPSIKELASTEESKLEITTAVLNFHVHARERHIHFLQSTSYHLHAALFIHELLKSLSGSSQLWFRELQIRSLEACSAIVESIGAINVRRCLPGIISATTKYIHRAHHGKDAVRVRLCAIELLHHTLASALQHVLREEANIYKETEIQDVTHNNNYATSHSVNKSNEDKNNENSNESEEETKGDDYIMKSKEELESVYKPVHKINKDSRHSKKEKNKESKSDKESEELTWMSNTIPHLHSALQSILNVSELCSNISFDSRTLFVLRSLVIVVLSSSLMKHFLHTPLASLLFATYHVLTSLIHSSKVQVANTSWCGSVASEWRLPSNLECGRDAQNALRRYLMEWDGLELLHLATSILHHNRLRTLILVKITNNEYASNGSNGKQMEPTMTSELDNSVDAFLFTLLIRKCIRIVNKTFTKEEYYHYHHCHFYNQPDEHDMFLLAAQSQHCYAVNQFLLAMAHALFEMSTSSSPIISEQNNNNNNNENSDNDNSSSSSRTNNNNNSTTTNITVTKDDSIMQKTAIEDEMEYNEFTCGEVLTNILFAECEGILEDWYEYDIHPAVVYVFARIIIWQFSHRAHVESEKWEKIGNTLSFKHGEKDNRQIINKNNYRHSNNNSCNYSELERQEEQEELMWSLTLPVLFINDGVFDELWSVIGMSHLWNISLDEEHCSFEQLKHRQVVASTILGCLGLVAEHVFESHIFYWMRSRTTTSLNSTYNNDYNNDINNNNNNSNDIYAEHDSCNHQNKNNHNNMKEEVTLYINAYERFVTRTLYLVLEKAANVSIVHETAMHVLHTYARVEASCSLLSHNNNISIISKIASPSLSYTSMYLEEQLENKVKPEKKMELLAEQATLLPTHNASHSTANNSTINTNLHFILKYKHLVVDEALHSSKVNALRNSASSILRGVVAFLIENITKPKRKSVTNQNNATASNTNNIIELEHEEEQQQESMENNSSEEKERELVEQLTTKAIISEIRSVTTMKEKDKIHSRLIEIVKSSMSVSSVLRKVSETQTLDEACINAIADFLSASVSVALECCDSIWEEQNNTIVQNAAISSYSENRVNVNKTYSGWNAVNNAQNYNFDAEIEDMLQNKRSALVLLCDSAHLAALLNFSTSLIPPPPPPPNNHTYINKRNDNNANSNNNTVVKEEAENVISENCDSECDEERQTTSSNMHVQLLQRELLVAIDKLLLWYSTLDRLTSYAVRAIIEILTVFLTSKTVTRENVNAQNKAHDDVNGEKLNKNKVNNHVTNSTKKEVDEVTLSLQEEQEEQEEQEKVPSETMECINNNNVASEDVTSKAKESSQTIKTTTTTTTSNATTSTKSSYINSCQETTYSTHRLYMTLPQSMLKVIYKVYLSFTSMLKEPIATLFVNTNTKTTKRTAEETRMLLAIPVRVSLLSVLEGLHALLLFASDFLIQRMVHEVIPLCLVWYEKLKHTRIPTDTENRLKRNIEEFALVLHTLCYTSLQHELEQMCQPYFDFLTSSQYNVREENNA